MLVQGVGAVGANLVRELSAAGARVLVSDVDVARAPANRLRAWLTPADAGTVSVAGSRVRMR